MKISFLSDTHYRRFEKIRSKMAKRYQNDKEYLSVAYVMAGNAELEKKISPYFDTQEGYLDASALFEEQDLTHGLSVLVSLAVNLFNYGLEVSPINLVNKLDEDNFFLAVNAIKLRRFGI